jgi:hypothetical protein
MSNMQLVAELGWVGHTDYEYDAECVASCGGHRVSMKLWGVLDKEIGLTHTTKLRHCRLHFG